MRRARIVLAAGICAVLSNNFPFPSAAAESLPPVVTTQQAPPVAPAQAAPPAPRTGVKIELKVPQFPAILPSKTATPPQAWPAEEISAAKARCAAILKRIDAVAIPEAPLKEGSCGTPAPIQLVSVGRNPQIAMSPPATVTCDFAEALHAWMKTDVAPLAKMHLGSDIIRIDVMSSYSCRAAYGRSGNRLSEHATGSALDIRGFVTSSGKTALVLEDWGTPQREIIARVNAEKVKAAKALAAQQAAEKAAQAAQMNAKSPAPGTTPPPPASIASSIGAPGAGIATSSVSSGEPRVTVTLPGGTVTEDEDAGLAASLGSGLATGLSMSPNKLGGPGAQLSEAERKRNFLRAVHAAACRVFGTTLGPEANAAHRNHLHVDIAQRTNGLKICDR